MKKIIIIVIMLSLFLSLLPLRTILSNDIKRISIIELFTATWCAYCPEAETAMSDTYNSSGDKIVYVTYHINDDLATAETTKRSSYYGVFGTPTAEVNGNYRFVGPSSIKSTGIDRALTDAGSLAKVGITFANLKFSGSEIAVDVTASGTTETPLDLFVVLSEDNVKPTSNSTKTYRFVARTIKNYEAVSLPVKQTVSMQIADSFNKDSMYIIAFVQNKKTMEIYNASELKAVISAKQLIAPTITNTESKVTSFPFTIKLSLVQGASNYELQVAKDAGFNNIILDKEMSINSFTIGEESLSSGICYFRARAKNGNEVSNWSNAFNIAVETTFQITMKIGSTNMNVNGQAIEIDPGRATSPVIVKEWGRTIVPIRALVETLGGTVAWDDKEQSITIQMNSTQIKLYVDSPKAMVNRSSVWIDDNNHSVKPLIINGRTMVPLRFVSQSIGCNVSWDPLNQTISIVCKR